MEIFHSPLLFFFFITLPLTATELSRSADKIAPSQLVRDTETLVSAGAKFELGFFSAGNSSNRYVGIWFYNIPVKTVVWVANRDHPINGSSGVLQMGRGGNLVIVDGTGRAVWSTSTPNVNSDNVVAQLLDSGNLVLIDKENIGSGIFLWESFDHPFDTLLAGMKLGWDLRTGLNRYLTSWRNSDDPSTGDITYAVELQELPEKFLRRNASVIERGGLWEANQFSRVSWGSRGMIAPQFVSTAREVYYTYVLNSDSSITRAVLNHSGMLQRWIWSNITQWTLIHELPNDFCDEYANCGPNAVCMIGAVPLCSCLTGYTPKSPQEWAMNVWSRGCVKKKPLNCPKGEVFEKLEDVKAPHMLSHWVDISMSLDECRAKCLKNCTCTAYTPADIVGEGSGCLLWYGDLIDIRKLIQSNSNLNVFIRVMASDLGKQKWTLWLVAPIVAASLSLTMLLLICFWKRTKKRLGNIAVVVSLSLAMLLPICFCRRRTKKRLDSEVGKELDGTTKDQELALLDITTIKAATDNFASTNKLGQGGFGAVYKGRLASGQEVAVKRLSKSSGQGNQEFKNEAMLIAKLQHRNLVRLLGCCISRDERMLIYEYLPNKSLDCFIFNEAKRATLDWNQRFKIILGIARGVLYLHQDSRLKIIHRDLKASNVLLDVAMNPKISDFGMAKMFGDDQIQANTNRVVGTYGYMSPEYAMQGFYSIKSDVFSFGVILLEIVSGKRTTDFYNDSASLNLIAHVWNLWKEGKSSDTVDSLMGQPYDSRQLARIIQIGLLCVQEHAPDRPTMMDIILMLGNEAALASPNKPAFILNGSTKILDLPSIGGASANDITITELDGR